MARWVQGSPRDGAFSQQMLSSCQEEDGASSLVWNPAGDAGTSHSGVSSLLQLEPAFFRGPDPWSMATLPTRSTATPQLSHCPSLSCPTPAPLPC